jgi:hypothetical protein
MARNYLRFYAWRSISGKNGHSALLVVVTNLRLFFCLEQSVAMNLLKDLFNPRCTDLQGDACAWSDAEITHKWNEAGKADAYPTLGVKHPRARAKEARFILEGEVAEFLEGFTQEGGAINPTTLRLAFIAYRGGEVVEETPFGRAVSTVTGKPTATPGGKRVFQGFHLTETGLGFTKREGEAA